MLHRNTRLVSTGRHVPPREVPNAQLKERLPAEFVDKMEQRTGIATRWYAPDDWASSDLALPAAHQALERAGKSPGDIDLIVVGTDSPDYITPSTSVVLQHKLGAKRAGTFDVGCACASFPSGLAIASGLVAQNPGIDTVLVVGVYMMRKLADPDDPMSFLYGDGAGAAVLEASEEQGVLGAAFQADGAYADRWGIYAGGTAAPATVERVEAGETQVRVLGKYPREVNEDGWPALVRKVADRGGFSLRDIDLVIFTQVNKGTIEAAMQRLEMPWERTHTIMEKWGYTGSACIPMALDDAIEQGVAKPGDLVVLIGSGVGYNQAGVALRL